MPVALAAAACTSNDTLAERLVERRVDIAVEVSLADTSVRQLAPIPVRLLWTTGPEFEPWGDALRARLSFVDAAGRTRFELDHELNPPLQTWLPEQEVEALLLASTPSTAPTGVYRVRVDLYSPAAAQVRFVLTGDPHAPGEVEILPSDPEEAPIYMRGWGSLEIDVGGSWSTWRWVWGQAEWRLEPEIVADSVTIWARSPAADPGSPQTLTLWAGESLLGTRRLVDSRDFVWSVPIGLWPERQVFRLQIERTATARRTDDQGGVGLQVFNLSMHREHSD